MVPKIGVHSHFGPNFPVEFVALDQKYLASRSKHQQTWAIKSIVLHLRKSKGAKIEWQWQYLPDFQNLRGMVQKIRRPHRESLQQDSAGKVPVGHWHGWTRLRVLRYRRVILPPTKTFDPLLSVIPSPVYQKILARANLKPRRSVNTSVKYWRPCSKISWGFVHRCFEKATILKKSILFVSLKTTCT